MNNYELKQIQVNSQPLSFYHPKNDDTIFGTLSCLRENRFHLTEIGFQPGDIFVDLGCNVGLVSLMVAKFFPEVKVFSFDASPISIECLRLNCGINQIINIQSFQLAVGDSYKKNLRFYSNSKEISCLVDGNLMDDVRTDFYIVNQISVEDIFDSRLLGIERIKYLKCDIEGSEFQAFERLFARLELLDRIDFLHLEIHPFQIYRPEILREKIQAKFKDRVFFDV